MPIESISQAQPRLRSEQFVKQPDYQHSTTALFTTGESEKHARESNVWRVIRANAGQPGRADRSLSLVTKAEVIHGVVRPAINGSLLTQVLFPEKTGETLLPPPVLRSSTYKPRTKLGKTLWGLRLRVAASGARLLDWDAIEQEVVDRRESTRAADK